MKRSNHSTALPSGTLQDGWVQLRLSFLERGRVWKEGERWIAVIDDGWWMAYGKSEREAVQKVLKKYDEEAARW